MSGPGFYEFLIEAELQQYYNAFKNDLKVSYNVTISSLLQLASPWCTAH
jgi:hypothetical protein